jgi:hypothetical protein
MGEGTSLGRRRSPIAKSKVPCPLLGTFRKYGMPRGTSAFGSKADLLNSTVGTACSATACSRNERLWNVETTALGCLEADETS